MKEKASSSTPFEMKHLEISTPKGEKKKL